MADFDEMLRTPATIYPRRGAELNDMGESADIYRARDGVATFIHFVRTKQLMDTDAGLFTSSNGTMRSRRAFTSHDVVGVANESGTEELWLVQNVEIIKEPFTETIHHYKGTCKRWYGSLS